jgi:hypothetical protein
MRISRAFAGLRRPAAGEWAERTAYKCRKPKLKEQAKLRFSKKQIAATTNAGGKSQLSRSKSLNLKISGKPNPKTETPKTPHATSNQNPKLPSFEAKSLYFR